MSSDVIFCNRNYRAGHSLNLYYNALHMIRPYVVCLPKAWGDYKPNRLFQELLLTLINMLDSNNPRSSELAIQELTELLALQTEHIKGGLESYKGFLLSTESNKEFLQLTASITEAEARAVAAHDFIALEALDISSNLLFMLNKSIVALDAMADWTHAFCIVFSTSDTGKIMPDHKWNPWDEEKIKDLLTAGIK